MSDSIVPDVYGTSAGNSPSSTLFLSLSTMPATISSLIARYAEGFPLQGYGGTVLGAGGLDPAAALGDNRIQVGIPEITVHVEPYGLHQGI